MCTDLLMNSDEKPKIRSIRPTCSLLVKIYQNDAEMDANRYFQASWASQAHGLLVVMCDKVPHSFVLVHAIHQTVFKRTIVLIIQNTLV